MPERACLNLCWSSGWLLGLMRLPLLSGLLLVACSSAPPARQSVPLPASGWVTLTAEQGSDLAIHAMGLVGTPYRYGGNTPDSGFDCSGLIGYVYQSRAGRPPPRTVALLADFGLPVPARERRTGDLVLFGDSPASHAGIYVGEGRFVHAPSSGGTVRLDRLDSGHWVRQPMRFRRP